MTLPKQIHMVATSAVTPIFDSTEALLTAWCAGEVPPARPMNTQPIVPWHTLATQALEHIVAKVHDRSRCGVVLATTKANMPAIEQWMTDARSARTAPPMPEMMSDSLGQLVEKFSLGGPSYCVSTACTSGLTAMIEAAGLVESGAVPEAIAVAADTITDFTRDGFNALRALTASTCRPFDKQRDGLQLGSAAAACLVRPRGISHSTSHAITIAGWGMSADAVHLTAPDRQAGGLIRAIRAALAMAAIRPDEVDAVVLHGTGTRYNDAMEASAMNALFPHQPPLTALKGLIGHTLGTAGLIETILAAQCMIIGVVPPVTGLQQSEYTNLNLVSGCSRKKPLQYVLKTASGFGGLNAALILSQAVRT